MSLYLVYRPPYAERLLAQAEKLTVKAKAAEVLVGTDGATYRHNRKHGLVSAPNARVPKWVRLQVAERMEQ